MFRDYGEGGFFGYKIVSVYNRWDIWRFEDGWREVLLMMYRGIALKKISLHISRYSLGNKEEDKKRETQEHHWNIFGPYARGFQAEYGYEAHARAVLPYFKALSYAYRLRLASACGSIHAKVAEPKLACITVFDFPPPR